LEVFTRICDDVFIFTCVHMRATLGNNAYDALAKNLSLAAMVL